MDNFRKTWLMLLVLSTALSLISGYFRAEFGWHNGLSFLIMFVLLSILSRVPSGYGKLNSVQMFGPVLFGVILAAALSTVATACGIVGAGEDLGYGGAVLYFIAIAACGFALAGVNLFIAAREGVEPTLGPNILRGIISFLLFIIGLIAIAADGDNQDLMTASYAGFCAFVGFVFMWRSTRTPYAL